MVRQPLEDTDSDDTDGSDDEQCKDNKREFHLGRFCARRTKTYHELSHWEVRSGQDPFFTHAYFTLSMHYTRNFVKN